MLRQASLNSLDLIRNNTNQFLSNEKLSTSRVVNIQTNEIPARLLAFNFYGSTELVNDVIDLNQDINVSFFSGQIDILTDD